MKQYALLVGVSCFENKLPSLDYVESDVHAFCNVLIDHFGLEYPDIEYLTNSSATQAAVMDAVNIICQKASKGDRIILYFATHGKTTYNTTYLSAYDAIDNNESDIDGWIRIEKILGKFHSVGCSILAFIDSCHSTQFCISRAVDENIDSLVSNSSLTSEYMAVFAAAGENEKSYPDPAFGHGCWTYYLLEALSGREPRAFSGNSSRITIHSLQPYLKEKVSARMRTEYQKTQTPHIWGTYSDDVVIIEHPITEGQRMKIKDIYFGEIDTDSEKDSVPNNEYITKNFYDLNSICNKLNSNNSIQVVLGNKGSGKTYLGEFLEASNNKTIYQSVGAITLTDILNLTSAQGDVRGKYVQAWTYSLYTLLSCIIVKESRPGSDEFHSLLKEIYGEQLDAILDTFVSSTKLLLNKRIKRGVRLSDSFNTFEEENGITNIDGLILLYSYLFNKHYKTEKLYFLLDGLDEQLRGALTDEQKKFLLDLLATVDQSHRALNGVKIILLFRNDLIHVLSGEANINKTITARSCTLSWLSTNPTYADTPLYQFLQKRIDTSAEALGITTAPQLCDILPPDMQGTKTWEWILKLTTHTPRDIVSFFNCCKQFSGEQHYLTVENLWDATRPYSDYLWTEFQDVLTGTALSGHAQDLLTFFDKLVLNKNLRKNTRFNFTDFKEIYEDTPELSDIPISVALKILYESGMMCVHTNSGTYWNFRENPLTYSFDTWKVSVFEIHTGLWKKLHIW